MPASGDPAPLGSWPVPATSGTTRDARARHDLTVLVKAYDVRGLVGDQLDADVARALGAGFAEEVAGQSDRVVVGHDMRPSSPELAAAFAAGVASRGDGRRARGPVQHRRALLRQRGARRTRCDVHGQPQPRRLQRHQAVPGRRPAGQPRHRPRANPRPGPGAARRCRRRVAGVANASITRAGPARRVRLVPARARRSLRRPPAAGRGRRRQRHGAASPPPPSSAPPPGCPRCRSTSSRCTSSSTAPSPTTRPTRWNRRTCATCRRPWSGRAPTSGWPSTATPTAASWSTSAASRSRRRR